MYIFLFLCPYSAWVSPRSGSRFFTLCSCPFRIMTVVSVIPFSCRSSSMVFLLRLSSFCSSLWLGVRSCAMYTFLRVRSSSSLRCLAFFKMVFLLLMSVNSTRMGLVSVSNFLPSRLLIIWALSAPKMTHIFFTILVSSPCCSILVPAELSGTLNMMMLFALSCRSSIYRAMSAAPSTDCVFNFCILDVKTVSMVKNLSSITFSCVVIRASNDDPSEVIRSLRFW